MAPRPRRPHGNGDGGDGNGDGPGRPRDGEGGEGGEGTPSQRFGDIDAGQGVSSAQEAIGEAVSAGRPKEGGGSPPPKGDDEGGDGGGDDPTGRPAEPGDGQDPYDAMTPEEQRAAKDELIADSNERFPMTEATAEAILRSGPPGTRPVVAGPGEQGADVRFVDSEGNEVARTENKNLDGGPNAFNRNLGHAAGQVNYDGTVAVQVKPGTDINELMHKFTGNRSDAQLEKYAGVDVVFYDENGNVLGTYNAGTRP